MPIGLPDLGKEIKLSKILIYREIFNILYLFYDKGRHFTIFFTSEKFEIDF